MKVAIVGLGYVGLPLALQFSRSGNTVLGLDIDTAKVTAINSGRSYIKHLESAEVERAVRKARLRASTEFADIKGADAIIICVPTPLNKNREPDLSFILQTGQKLAPHLQKGHLVVLESTTYPGTTEIELRTVLESGSGLRAGVDFHLAFSPEREDPGNPASQVQRITAAIQEVIDSAAFAGGPFVARFEQQFAAYCECEHAVGVGSGTDALWLTLLACGVGAGDEVITVPNTFIATAEAISFCGATPVFVDIDERTYTMDPDALEASITPRTRAIIPVHLYGQTADMTSILAVARRHRLVVIEDACQAHGARYRGRRAGSLADAGCFSFYPGKNLGAFGEAGAVVTANAELAERIRILRDHGQTRKYVHQAVGWNGRMDGIQAAVLSVKLSCLDAANRRRQTVAKVYGEQLGDVDEILLPTEAESGAHVYHLYVVRVPHRDQLLQALASRGISCGIHYPVPIHLQQAYGGLHLPKGSFPVAERCAGEVLSLPMFPELTPEQVRLVAEVLKSELEGFESRRVLATA